MTMISAYERDLRQPTLTTLLRLLHAAGFDLRLHLAAYDPHDDVLAELEAGRLPGAQQGAQHVLHDAAVPVVLGFTRGVDSHLGAELLAVGCHHDLVRYMS
jgi:hypothetical protein